MLRVGLFAGLGYRFSLSFSVSKKLEDVSVLTRSSVISRSRSVGMLMEMGGVTPYCRLQALCTGANGPDRYAGADAISDWRRIGDGRGGVATDSVQVGDARSGVGTLGGWEARNNALSKLVQVREGSLG